ncbi:MAG: HD domain-containing phosphohydrolase [Deltaproteobacteria bacterium]
MKSAFTVLVIDDDEDLLLVNSRMLKSAGYEVIEAVNGKEGLKKIKENLPDMILLDVVLPDVNGIDLCRQIKSDPQLPGMFIVLISSLQTMPEQQAEGLEYGADGYISRPIQKREFLARIESLVRIIKAEKELQRYREHLEELVQERTNELKMANEKLNDALIQVRKALNGTIHAASAIISMRDDYTAKHQRHVAQLAIAIASEMGFSYDRTEGIWVTGFLHDIGKTGVPLEILSKPPPLSKIEVELIKAHVEIGYNALKDMGFPWPVADVILQHHEMLDGSGYPKGLKGDEISIEARIIAVANTMESKALPNPQAPGIGIEKTLLEIEKNKGILYDEQVVEACLKLFKDGGFKFE